MTVPGSASGLATPILHLPTFDGPLDLLLQLVERRRLPITQLSLALVADQYLAQVRSGEGISPDALGLFLDVGARLALLKSRALLPAITPPEPEPEIDAELLVRRLEEYHQIRQLAEALGLLEGRGPSFARGVRSAEPVERLDRPLAPIDVAELARLLLAMETSLPGERSTPLVMSGRLRVTVAERLATIRMLLTSSPSIEWDAIAGDDVSGIVATLLAVLELIRRGEITVEQRGLFAPIRLVAAQEGAAASGDGATLGEAELPQEDDVVLASAGGPDVGVGG